MVNESQRVNEVNERIVNEEKPVNEVNESDVVLTSQRGMSTRDPVGVNENENEDLVELKRKRQRGTSVSCHLNKTSTGILLTEH